MGERGPLAEAVVIPLASSPLTVLNVPEMPTGLLKATRNAWEAYWQSTVARTVELESDLPAVIRWIGYIDEWNRALKVLTKEGFAAEGSQGQPVVSPTVHYIAKLESMIGRLEGQLGLTPMARARLGLNAAEGQMAVHQLNAMARQGDADADYDSTDEEEGAKWTKA